MPSPFVKIPVVAKKMFPNYTWNIATTENSIYLTFDDGPTPDITNWTLNTLKTYNAKATFFCIGKNIENHPATFQNIINEGHTVGNHTYNHIKGWKTDVKTYLENIEHAQNVINAHSPNNNALATRLFRPPYGKITPKQGKRLLALNYKIIMWDIISFDWDKNTSQEACLNNVITKTENGSIVVFHDSLKASKNMQYALPRVLKYYSQKGYSFKTLPH